MNWNKTKSVVVVVHRETMEKLCMWLVDLIVYTCVVPFLFLPYLTLSEAIEVFIPAIIITPLQDQGWSRETGRTD